MPKWKALSAFGAFVLVLGLEHGARAQFWDVPPGHWAADAVQNLVQLGYLQGFPDGSFRGSETVTRYQLALLLHRVLADIDTRFSKLQSALGALGGRIPEGGAASVGDIIALLGAVDELHRETRELSERLAALEEGIAALEKAPSPAPSVPPAGERSALLEEVARLERSLAEERERTGALAERLAGLAEEISALEARLRELEDRYRAEADFRELIVVQGAELVDLSQRVRALEEAAKTALPRSEFASWRERAEAVLSQVAALAQRVERLEADLAEERRAGQDREERLKAVEEAVKRSEGATFLREVSLEARHAQGSSALDFDRLTGIGDGTTEDEVTAGTWFGARAVLGLEAPTTFGLRVYHDAGLFDLGRLEVAREGVALAYGRDLSFRLTPYFAAQPEGYPSRAFHLSASWKDLPLRAEAFVDPAGPRGGRLGLELPALPALAAFYVNPGAGEPSYGLVASGGDDRFSVEAGLARGGVPLLYLLAEARQAVGPAAVRAAANYRDLPAASPLQLASGHEELAPFYQGQKGWGLDLEAEVPGLGGARARYHEYDVGGDRVLAYGVRAGADLFGVRVGGFYEVAEVNETRADVVPVPGEAWAREGGFRGGGGGFLRAEAGPLYVYGEYRVGPGSSGYTVAASYQGGLAGLEVKGALHATSFAVPSPLYKAALELGYKVPLGVAVLAPKGFVGLVRGGGLPEDTLLYRAALEAQVYGWTLEAAYGSLKTSAEGWPAGGKDRSFDPWYPGLFDGVPQAAAERRGFSVRAAYQGFEVVYHALFFPAQEHVLVLGYTLR